MVCVRKSAIAIIKHDIELPNETAHDLGLNVDSDSSEDGLNPFLDGDAKWTQVVDCVDDIVEGGGCGVLKRAAERDGE